MAQTQGTTELIRGAVEQANEKGVKVGGRWFNYSQFSTITAKPDEGDTVEMDIAKGRFINALRITDGGFDLVIPDDDPLAQGAPVQGGRSTAPPRAASAAAPATYERAADRNTEIRRLALIKAAADYAAQRVDLTADDVLAIARQWETWVVDRP
jgi:hypothetical protein